MFPLDRIPFQIQTIPTLTIYEGGRHIGVITGSVAEAGLKSQPAMSAFSTTNILGLTVSGTLSYDATGTYILAGMYNGYPLYIRPDGNSFVVPIDGVHWSIALNPGGSDAWWLGNGLIGTYAPQGTATGTATVTVYSP